MEVEPMKKRDWVLGLFGLAFALFCLYLIAIDFVPYPGR
jgi:hypothetical protein